MDALRKNYKKILTLKQARKIIFLLVFVLCFDFLLFPAPVMADQAMEEYNLSQNQAITNALKISQSASAGAMVFNGKLPENQDINAQYSKYTVITAYNSEPGQTDDSPCITANNFNVCDYGVEDTIAANFLPFGAKVRIPELFGDRVFIVRDRMNQRYTHRVDVWMIEKPDALNFGVKLAKIEVLE